MRFILLTLSILLSMNAFASELYICFKVKVAENLDNRAICIIQNEAGQSKTISFALNSEVKIPIEKTGKYHLEFYSPGFKVLSKEITIDDSINLGDIVLESERIELNEASISANSNHLQIANETISYDVSADPANLKRPLKSILTELPFVRKAGVKDELEVGDGNFIITVNGKRNLAISTKNINYVSEILKGDGIKSVSINLSPSGEYSSYSAVINIVTDKNLIKDFYAAEVDATFSDAVTARTGIQATVKSGNLIASPSYAYKYTNERPTYRESHRYNNTSYLPSFHSTDTIKKNLANSHNVGVKMSYDISQKDILLAEATYSYSNNKSSRSSAFTKEGLEAVEVLDKNVFNAYNKGESINTNISYQHQFGSQLPHTLTAQYIMNSNHSDRVYNNAELLDNATRNTSHRLSLDYFRIVNPLLNYYVTTGYTHRHYTSESASSSLLDYNQSLLYAKGNISYRIKKILLSGEITAEHSNDISNSNNLLYSIYASYPIAAGHYAMLNTSYSIYRAGINELNEYRNKTIAGLTTMGNASLSAQKSLSITGVYRYFIGNKFDISPMISYIRSGVGIYNVYSIDENGTLLCSPKNLNGSNQLNIGISSYWTPCPKLNVSFMYRIRREKYNLDSHKLSNWDNVLMVSSNYSLSDKTRLFFYAYWQNPDMAKAFYPQSLRKHNLWKINIAASHRINNNLSISLDLNNPWSSQETEIREFLVDNYRVVDTKILPRTRVMMSVIWRFGALRNGVKSNSRGNHSYDQNKVN